VVKLTAAGLSGASAAGKTRAVPHILAVANQKGGVAKTTTVASLGTAPAEMGGRVLLVDLDPQACLILSLRLDPDALELPVHKVLLGNVPASMAVLATQDGPDLLPATIDLAGFEAMLLMRTGRGYARRNALEDLFTAADTPYDDVLIDCPPSLGVLTINGLTAAEELLIPLQCEMLSTVKWVSCWTPSPTSSG
jgi:chromosome partitioning protein